MSNLRRLNSVFAAGGLGAWPPAVTVDQFQIAARRGIRSHAVDVQDRVPQAGADSGVANVMHVEKLTHALLPKLGRTIGAQGRE